MVPWNPPFVIACCLVFLSFLGCGGGGESAPPAGPLPLTAPANLQGRALTDYSLAISWTRLPTPSDGYELEGRVEEQPFAKLHAGLIPPNLTELWLNIDPAIPEITPLEFRLRAMRESQIGPYSDVLHIANPLRQPYPIDFTWGYDTCRFKWTNASLVAEQVRIERATGNSLDRTWTVLGSVSVTSRQEFFDDTFPDGEQLTYRLISTAQGVDSAPAEMGALVPLRSPTALAAQPIAGGARLTWTNRSARSPKIRILRSPGLDWCTPLLETVATLAPGTTTYDDLALPLGTYTYLVIADLGNDQAPSQIANFVTPPVSTVPLISAEFIKLPFRGTIQGGPDQGWWLVGMFDNEAKQVVINITPGSIYDGKYELLPGFTDDNLDNLNTSHMIVFSGTEPHIFSVVLAQTGKSELRHAWRSQDGWVSESVLTRDGAIFSLEGLSSNGELNFWVIDVFGVEHAVKKNGIWQIEDLHAPFTGLELDGLHAVSSPDGTLQVCMKLWSDQSEKLRLYQCSTEGIWSWEDVPMPPGVPDAQLMAVYGIRFDDNSVNILVEVPSADITGADNMTLWVLRENEQGWLPAEQVLSLPSLGSDRYVDFAVRGGQSTICMNKSSGMWLYLKSGDADWNGIQLGVFDGCIARTGFDLVGNPWAMWLAGSSSDGGELFVVNRVIK